METGHDSDVDAVRSLIATLFESMDWEPSREPIGGPSPTFSPGTTLIPAARPAKHQAVDAFMERMKGLEAERNLRSFREEALGIRVQVFGNVAVALGACEMAKIAAQRSATDDFEISAMRSRCLVSGFDGALFSSESKDALWARFYTAAPPRQRRSVEQYRIVKRA
jgi:hypothetical protein